MLVLSRKVGETIVINKDIVVTVVGLSGGTVRVGFQASGDIPIFRGELGPTTHRTGVLKVPSDRTDR